jgi:hypothetical protein
MIDLFSLFLGVVIAYVVIFSSYFLYCWRVERKGHREFIDWKKEWDNPREKLP